MVPHPSRAPIGGGALNEERQESHEREESPRGYRGGSADGTTTLTLWHNSTTGPGQEYWENAAAAFEEANPGVTIEIQAVQNEDLDAVAGEVRDLLRDALDAA